MRGAASSPLTGLLIAVGIFGCAWALIMPPWQGPDEIQHFSYVESLAERNARPGALPGTAPDLRETARPSSTVIEYAKSFRDDQGGPNATSSAVLDALIATNADGVTVGLAKPEQSRLAFRRWQEASRSAPATNGGGVFPGSSNPPAYYAAARLGYALAGPGAGSIGHLYTARLFSVLWLLLTTAGVWLLAGELTARHRPSQMIASAAVGLWPMLSFISSTVNPDSLLYASWTWVFWLLAVIVMRGLTAKRLVALAALTGLALFTKEISVALLPAVGFVTLLGLWRLRRAGRRAWAPPAVVLLLGVGLPAVAYIGLTLVENRPLFPQATGAFSGGVGNTAEFLSYVWQYYLPRLPGQEPFALDIPSLSSYPAYNVWVASSWGAFGWVTLQFPRSFYPWFLAITVLVGAAALARLLRAAWRTRRSPALRTYGLPLALCFGLTALILVMGLHVSEYKLRSPTNQGRYLFSMAAVAGLAVALALRWVPRRAQEGAVGAVLAAFVVFQIGSLGYVAAHYYA